MLRAARDAAGRRRRGRREKGGSRETRAEESARLAGELEELACWRIQLARVGPS